MPTLRMPASLASLGAVAEYAAGLAALARFGERDTYRLRLILDELVTNIAVHGAVRPDEPFEVFGRATPGQVLLEIVDRAPPFDPVDYRPVEPECAAEDAGQRLGGLGLVLVRAAADRLEYRRTGEGNSTTVLVVHRRPGEPAGQGP